jgi:large subunit ribosomal protein L37Ae
MSNTKKVGTTGRFGSRYGVAIRKRTLNIEKKQHKLAPCPFCGFSKVKREAAGLFNCHKCAAKFTGGAYESETLVGKSIKKMVTQRTFIAGMADLNKAKESSFADIEKEVEASLGAQRIEESKQHKKRAEALQAEAKE